MAPYMFPSEIGACTPDYSALLRVVHPPTIYIGEHSRLGYYFWDKGLKDFVALDLGVYHDLLLFNQLILMR